MMWNRFQKRSQSSPACVHGYIVELLNSLGSPVSGAGERSQVVEPDGAAGTFIRSGEGRLKGERKGGSE